MISRHDDGIVVEEVERGSGMESNAVPAVLRERLGPGATGALVDVFEAARREWSEDVIAVCGDRFERRFVEEVSQLRLEVAQGDAALRQEMTTLGANLRQEMTTLGANLRQETTTLEANLRQEMTALGSNLRQEMTALGANLRQDISAGRFELLKWCFLFWVGQVVAVAGVVGLMLRILRP